MASKSSKIDPSMFAPAIPIPLVIGPQIRIDHLKELLTQKQWQHQRLNIIKLIKLYESGERKPPTSDTQSSWLLDGEVINYEPTIKEMARQMTQQTVPVKSY